MAKIKIIANEPALIIESKKEKTLVIGDLHIGIEAQLGTEKIAKKAINDLVEKIIKLIEETKSGSVVLVGDIRHKLPKEKEYWQQLSEEEEVEHRISIEIPEILFRLKKHADVRIIPGNHDGGLKSYFETAEEITIENIGIVHSHKWPSKEMMEAIDTLIVAHSHPAVIFKDQFGYKTKQKAWVKGTLDSKELKTQYPNINKDISVIILPVFNPLITGSPINEKEKFLGPLLKDRIMKINEIEVFLLDGTQIKI
ncbi:MAG: metallophosphoesterase [Candidatus Micrarchaeota archaeon]|nr:metallophosphoesterase [Candidatus Micrarchaeota archaeon]